MQALIEGGADALIRGKFEITTLQFAVKEFDCMRIALQRGCNAKLTDNILRTPYHHAGLLEFYVANAIVRDQNQEADIMGFMRLNGANIPAKDSLGRTAEEYYQDRQHGILKDHLEHIDWIDHHYCSYRLHWDDVYGVLSGSATPFGNAMNNPFYRSIYESWCNEYDWEIVDNTDDEDYVPGQETSDLDLDDL